MPQDKIIQPSKEFEQEYKSQLINVATIAPAISTEADDIKVLSSEELDRADRAVLQKANLLIAQEQLKELPDRSNLNDTPYVHNSTHGYGAYDWAIWGLFPNNRSQRILVIFFLTLAAIGLLIKYAPYIIR